jgi:hypothetical protein
MKTKYIISFFFTILFIWISFWYFENKYYCEIWWDKIVVTISKWNNIKCLEYIRNINKKIEKYEWNIKNANIYISKKEDIKYWADIKSQLEHNKKNIILIKMKIIEYMENFEKSFFLKIKKMLSYYLNQDKKKFLKIINYRKEIYNTEIWNGNIENILNTLKKIDNMNIQVSLIEKMMIATDFESLIPYLKFYLKVNKQ